jgi:hypothetical protein
VVGRTGVKWNKGGVTMNKPLHHTPVKIVLIILGYIFWRTFLTQLVGEEAVMGAFLVQAIYCRLRYFRDNQLFGSADYYIEIEAEVVEWRNITYH